MRKKKLFKQIIVFVSLMAVPLAVYLTKKPLPFFGRAFGTKANLVIDAGSSFAVPGGSWKNLAQGGEEKERMLACCTGQIKVLSPKYIRIDHLFDYYDVVSRTDGHLSFNWTKLDAVIGDIVQSGAKPFISLSYMPSVLASEVTKPPADWQEWRQLIKAAIEHISGAEGLAIADVYYEVWNEPDLFGKYKLYKDPNYLDLYYHTAQAAAQTSGVNRFFLGGPATTELYKNWIEGLILNSKENGLKLDFLSWHRYSKDLDIYEQDIVNAKKWVGELGMSDIELIISEAGPNSENDQVYDQTASAIHTLATTAVVEGEISRLFTFEIKDGPGPEKYWGRWGLLTHEKFGANEAKPRFKALEFLNLMEGSKVNVAGEGSWVKAFAVENSNTIKLLVVNYDPSGRHFEAVPVSFINLPFGRFRYTRKNFLGAASTREIQVDGKVWQTVENLDANQAAILEITPY